MDRAFIEKRIQELTRDEQVHFANWQRVQGAKAVLQELLAVMDKEAPSNGVAESKELEPVES